MREKIIFDFTIEVARRVKPYRTPPPSNLQSSATQESCGVVFIFFFCIIFFYNSFFFNWKIRFHSLVNIDQYFFICFHLQKCHTPKFEFLAETWCCCMDIWCMVPRPPRPLATFPLMAIFTSKLFFWRPPCWSCPRGCCSRRWHLPAPATSQESSTSSRSREDSSNEQFFKFSVSDLWSNKKKLGWNLYFWMWRAKYILYGFTGRTNTGCLKKWCFREPQPWLWVDFQNFKKDYILYAKYCIHLYTKCRQNAIFLSALKNNN